MRYEILGDLRVKSTSSSPLPITRKCEKLLAVLLARANQVVTADQLIEEVWGGKPPRRASATLYVYISQLRKLLNQSGRSGPILTRPRGYMLKVEPGELDADEFQWLTDRGKLLARSGRYDLACEAFRSAVDLWYGNAFGDLADHGEGMVVSAYSAFLEESKLECIELLMETELLRGNHREIIGELRALTTAHPLREKLYQHLMLALYRSDRRAEALEVYRTASGWLSSEVGIDPCRALQDLHQSILHDDALLTI